MSDEHFDRSYTFHADGESTVIVSETPDRLRVRLTINGASALLTDHQWYALRGLDYGEIDCKSEPEPKSDEPQPLTERTVP